MRKPNDVQNLSLAHREALGVPNAMVIGRLQNGFALPGKMELRSLLLLSKNHSEGKFMVAAFCNYHPSDTHRAE